MDLRKTLCDEIHDEFNQLEKYDPSVKEFKEVGDSVAKLLDREIEFRKLDIQHEENKLKLEQMKEDKIDRIVKHILTGMSIVGPICLTIWGTVVSINFEKEGIITTNAGRGFFQRLFSKK